MYTNKRVFVPKYCLDETEKPLYIPRYNSEEVMFWLVPLTILFKVDRPIVFSLGGGDTLCEWLTNKIECDKQYWKRRLNQIGVLNPNSWVESMADLQKVFIYQYLKECGIIEMLSEEK